MPGGGSAAVTADELIPIVQRAYDFAVDLYRHVNRFPRAQKPLLGRELVGLALRLLVTLVTSNRRRDKVPGLNEASGTVDALRITLRLSTRLSLLSHKGHEGLSRELDEIGRMLGGWLKQSAAVSAETPEARPAVPDAPAKRPRAPVRYRMTSPQVERYLRAAPSSPQTTHGVRRAPRPQRSLTIPYASRSWWGFRRRGPRLQSIARWWLCAADLPERAIELPPIAPSAPGFQVLVSQEGGQLLRQRGGDELVHGDALTLRQVSCPPMERLGQPDAHRAHDRSPRMSRNSLGVMTRSPKRSTPAKSRWL